MADERPDQTVRGVFRGMFTLLLGASAARLVGLLSMPMLTRLYEPDSFGALAVYTALAMQLLPLLTWRYAIALPLPRRDVTAFNLLGLGLGLSLVMTAISFGALFFTAAPILAWLGADAILVYWWLIPLGAAGLALFELMSQWGTRLRDYKTLARAHVGQSFLGEGTKLGFGLIGLQPMGLILGHIASQSAGILTLAVHFRADVQRMWPQLSLRRALFLARRYSAFPVYRLPSQLLLSFATQAPLLFVSALYDISTAGQFALAITALALPMNLIARTMSQAYYGEAARVADNPKELWDMSVAVQKRLFIFAIPFAAVLIFAAEPLFVVVFGDDWRQAGHFTALLAVYLALQVTSSPLMQALNILERQSVFLIMNLTRVAGLIGIYLWDQTTPVGESTFVLHIAIFLSGFYAALTIYVNVQLYEHSRSRT